MRLVASAVPPKRALVEISLVGERTMAALNRTYRNRKGTAQILTFSYGDDTSGGPEAEGAIGEIILCWKPIAAVARSRAVPPRSYLLRLLVHGLLHLKGYRHDDERDERAMERAERRYLRGHLGEDVMTELFA